MAVCKGCGKEILWVLVEGKKIPLDPVPAVYTVFPTPEGHAQEYIAERTRNAHVTHFATCKFANSFSRGRHADKTTVDE